MADAGKVMSDGEVNRLKSLLREAEDRITQLTKENKRMKAEIDKKEQYQSAFQSNSKAYTEKVELMEREARMNREEIDRLKSDN